MPAASDHEANVKFLVACIRNSTNGKISWQGVADECGLSTKNAANMRYIRLLKSHNVATGGGLGSAPGSPLKSPSKTPAKPRTPKKKTAKEESDDGDDGSPTKKRKTIKAEEASADHGISDDVSSSGHVKVENGDEA